MIKSEILYTNLCDTYIAYTQTHPHCLPRSVIMTCSVSWTKLTDGITKPSWPKTLQVTRGCDFDDFWSLLRDTMIMSLAVGIVATQSLSAKKCGNTDCFGHWWILWQLDDDAAVKNLPLRWLVEEHRVIPWWGWPHSNEHSTSTVAG